MGVSASWIRADWRKHDDAWPGAAVFHAPLEFDGRPGGAVFLDTIFREFSGHGGDQLAFAARGFLEGDQRRVFLFCSWFGVPWTWAVVFFDGVRGDLRARVRPVKSLDQSPRHTFAFWKRGGGGKFAELLVGDRRGLKPIPGGFFSGTYEFAGVGGNAHRLLPRACPGAFHAESRSRCFFGNPAEAIVGGFARKITDSALDFARAALLPLCWDLNIRWRLGGAGRKTTGRILHV